MSRRSIQLSMHTVVLSKNKLVVSSSQHTTLFGKVPSVVRVSCTAVTALYGNHTTHFIFGYAQLNAPSNIDALQLYPQL